MIRLLFIVTMFSVCYRSLLKMQPFRGLPDSTGAPGLKIAVMHAENLSPELKGGDARIAAVIDALFDLGQDVTFVFMQLGPHRDFSAIHKLKDKGVGIWGPCPRDMGALLSHLTSSRYDVIFAWLWPNEHYLSFLLHAQVLLRATGYPTVFTTVNDDLVSERYLTEHQKPWEFSQFEVTLWKRSNALVGINEEIVLSLQERYVSKPVYLLPFFYSEEGTLIPKREFAERTGLAYVGYDNPANTQALDWMCLNLLQDIYRYDIVLNVYGSVKPSVSECAGYTNFRHHGVVSEADLLKALSQSRLFVAPVFTKAGISTKIIKALSCGTPFVTTEQQSMLDHETGVQVMNLERFSDEVVQLYRDERAWRLNSERIKQTVRTKYGSSSHLSTLCSVLHDMSLRKPAMIADTRDIQQKNDITVEVDLKDHPEGLPELHCLFEMDGVRQSKMKTGADVYISYDISPKSARPSTCPKGTCKYVLFLQLVSVIAAERINYEHVDIIMIPSFASFHLFPKTVHHKLKVVPRSITCQRDVSQDKPDFRTTYNLPPSAVVFLAEFQSANISGFEMLTHTWCSIFSARADISLIIGIRNWRSHDMFAKSPCSPRIKVLTTGLSREMYYAADVFIDLSDGEHAASTAWAVASGLIVISAGKGETSMMLSSEIIEQIPVTSKLCGDKDCSGSNISTPLRDCMQAAVDSFESLSQLGRLGQQFACDHFSPKEICKIISFHLANLWQDETSISDFSAYLSADIRYQVKDVFHLETIEDIFSA